jgi:hypothetical protein
VRQGAVHGAVQGDLDSGQPVLTTAKQQTRAAASHAALGAAPLPSISATFFCLLHLTVEHALQLRPHTLPADLVSQRLAHLKQGGEGKGGKGRGSAGRKAVGVVQK